MVYLLYGNQEILVAKQISNLVKKRLGEDINDLNYRNFDVRETLIADIVEECETISFGSQYKVIVMDHCYFLEKDPSVKVRLDKKQDFLSLIKYIEHPFEDVDLILAAHSANLNDTNEVYKALIKHGAKVTALEDVTQQQWLAYVQAYFLKQHNAKITKEAAEILGERINYNLTTLLVEGNKLANYSKDIQVEEVELLTPKPLENDVFLMINSLTKGDKNTALKIFKNIRDSGVDNEPVRLLMLISSQLRALSQIMYLANQGNTSQTIAATLRMNPYRAKKALENARGVKLEQLYNALDNLYELDNKIKNRQVDGFYGLELFLFNQKFV